MQGCKPAGTGVSDALAWHRSTISSRVRMSPRAEVARDRLPPTGPAAQRIRAFTTFADLGSTGGDGTASGLALTINPFVPCLKGRLGFSPPSRPFFRSRQLRPSCAVQPVCMKASCSRRRSNEIFSSWRTRSREMRSSAPTCSSVSVSGPSSPNRN